jgi:hypothetical protein
MIDIFPARLSLGSPIEDPETKTYLQVVYLKSDAESKSEGVGESETGKGESQSRVLN